MGFSACWVPCLPSSALSHGSPTRPPSLMLHLCKPNYHRCIICITIACANSGEGPAKPPRKRRYLVQSTDRLHKWVLEATGRRKSPRNQPGSGGLQSQPVTSVLLVLKCQPVFLRQLKDTASDWCLVCACDHLQTL